MYLINLNSASFVLEIVVPIGVEFRLGFGGDNSLPPLTEPKKKKAKDGDIKVGLPEYRKGRL